MRDRHALVSSREIAATPALAFASVTSVAGHREWFPTLQTVEADRAWPAVGSRMVLTIRYGGRFEMLVVEASPPTRLVVAVRTPTAQSRVTHRFVGLSDGRTWYTKSVEATYRGCLRAFGPLFDRIIAGAVRREVARAGDYAESSVATITRAGDPR